MSDSATRPLKVFLCHSSGDKSTVRELYHQLNAEGWIDVWLDEMKLLPGQEWSMEIEKAVEEADIVLACLSTRSVDKEGYIQKELRFVLNIADEKPEGSIFVIPLKLDDCIVPRRLRPWQWVDYYPESQKRFAYQRLLESLRIRAARLGISFTKPGSSLHYLTTEEHIVLSDDVVPNKPVTIDVPRKKEEEEKLENQHRNQTRYTPTKSKVLLSPKLRLFIGVASVLLLLPLFIVGGVNYIGNNLFEFVTATLTPTTQLSTRFESDVTGTAADLDAQTVVATSTKMMTPTPTLRIGSTWISDIDGATLVYVPEGNFLMGSNYEPPPESAPTYYDFRPQYSLYLNAFWIDQTEVTNKQYEMCVFAGDCALPLILGSPLRSSYYGNSQYEDHPVVYVDWFMAKAYCEWAGRRLPTEAEWEKAARGIDGRIYPWGNEAPNGTLLNYNNYWTDTTVVQQYPAGKSPYGAYDMAGNVWEWTSSLYMPYPYDATDGREDLSAKRERALRGGSWYFKEGNAISIFRSGVAPADFLVRSDVRGLSISSFAAGHNMPYGAGTLGFRCAMTATP